MSNIFFEKEVEAALQALRNGEVILYPTDTIWGLGCDATNKTAIEKIFQIKNRDKNKNLIVLAADERDILKYIAAPDLAVFDFIQAQKVPTTIVFDNAIHLPENLVAADGSLAIRIVQDEFCRHLIKRLQKPIVSTSANTAGAPSPQTFKDIAAEIKGAVDHIVQWRQDEQSPAHPSQIIKWNKDGTHTFLRK